MNRQDSIRRLGHMINGIRFAMLTTIDEEGHLRSRPMAAEQGEFDGDLWFFSRRESTKVHELEKDNRVSVSYAQPETNRFISVTGRASLVRDVEKANELWDPLLRTWFPEGPDDPNVLLIKVRVEQAEYWDMPARRMLVLFNFMKSVVARNPHLESVGNEKLDLTG